MNDKLNWEVTINNKGNSEQNLITLNNILIPVSKCSITIDTEDIATLNISVPMDGKLNNVTINTNTTEYNEQVIIATAKE